MGKLNSDAETSELKFLTVITAHAHVHMIIRVYRLFGAHRTAHNLNGTVGNNFLLCGETRSALSSDRALNSSQAHVNVHVALSPGARLKNYQWEVRVELARNNFVSRFANLIPHVFRHD